MEKLYFFKIGGNVIDDEALSESFLKSFAKLQGPKILVHGGGKKASEISKALDIEPVMIDGRRITDARTLQIVTMVYGGLINKNIVAKLQAFGCNAIGLSGADANIIPAFKRPVGDIDYGYAGDVTKETINTERLHFFLQHDMTLVIAPLTHDGKGSILNTNADTIAGTIAAALVPYYKVQLCYCFEKKGVLRDVNDPDSYFKTINETEYLEYKESGIISDGMIPKLDNAFLAKKSGIDHLYIMHPMAIDDLLNNKEPQSTILDV